MNIPIRTTIDSVIKEDFNGNHTGLQGEKDYWNLKDQKSKNKDRSFDIQRSILMYR